MSLVCKPFNFEFVFTVSKLMGRTDYTKMVSILQNKVKALCADAAADEQLALDTCLYYILAFLSGFDFNLVLFFFFNLVLFFWGGSLIWYFFFFNLVFFLVLEGFKVKKLGFA